MSDQGTTDRQIRLEGIDNVRDVGGLPLTGGGATRPGVLLRSASPQYATPADIERLVGALGLSLVIDLRTAREIGERPSTPIATAGVETVTLSFLPEGGRTLPETGDDTDPLLRYYLGYLADRPENVVAAVRWLAANETGPALVHCAAGKDRTGVLVALVLDAVGVERAAVIADYALSADNVEALFRRWTTAEGTEMPSDLAPHLPRAEVLATVLATLDRDHGGAAAWLVANGLDPAALERLRARLT